MFPSENFFAYAADAGSLSSHDLTAVDCVPWYRAVPLQPPPQVGALVSSVVVSSGKAVWWGVKAVGWVGKGGG